MFYVIRWWDLGEHLDFWNKRGKAKAWDKNFRPFSWKVASISIYFHSEYWWTRRVCWWSDSFRSSHSLDMHIFIKKGKHFCKQNLHSSYIRSALDSEYISKRAQLKGWCSLCWRIRPDSHWAFLTTRNHHNTSSCLIPEGWRLDPLSRNRL